MISLKKHLHLIPLIFLCTFYVSDADAQQWTRFRGSDGQGIDTTVSVPHTWEADDFKWKINLPGTGNSSPVIWGDKIFVSCANNEDGIGYILAIDAQDGATLWQKAFDLSEFSMHVDNDLAAPTPAVDESSLFVIWYSNKKTTLIAMDHDGTIQWQADFEGIEARHGGGSSLMLTDSDVIFTREQEVASSLGGSWLAVNKQTGLTSWEVERENCESNSFSTPILIKDDGQEPKLIFTSRAHGFTALDPETAQILWERKGLLTARVVASPVYSNELIIGCRKGELVVVELDPISNHPADTALYTLTRDLSPYVPTPIVIGKFIYLFMDSGVVACVRLATGELMWKERPAGPIYGSPVWVDGNLYCITKAGDVLVIGANPEYHLKGILPLGDGSFSTPVMVESGMVFRTFSQLILFESMDEYAMEEEETCCNKGSCKWTQNWNPGVGPIAASLVLHW